MWADDAILWGWRGALDQVRVRYTKAGRSTGFTSRRVSCGWRDRSLVEDGAAEVGMGLATESKLDGRVGNKTRAAKRLGVKQSQVRGQRGSWM